MVVDHSTIQAIRRHGVPEKITIDGNEANAAAIRGYNNAHGTAIFIRQVKYLNNAIEIVLTQMTKTRGFYSQILRSYHQPALTTFLEHP